MVDGWASRGVSSTCWIVLNSFPVAGHESRGAIVRGMIPGPSGLRPWPKHSLGSKLGPSLIVSPFHFERMIDKPIPVNYDLIGDVFARNNPCPPQLGITLGSITAEQSFGGRDEFQCHYHCFQWSIFLVKNNQIGPHPHE